MSQASMVALHLRECIQPVKSVSQPGRRSVAEPQRREVNKARAQVC